MKNHDDDPLPSRLKHRIVRLFRIDLDDPDSISDHAPLINGSLGLDSLDALELAMCIEEEFGVTILSQAESLRAFASIESLAGFIHARTSSAQPVSSRLAAGYILSPSS